MIRQQHAAAVATAVTVLVLRWENAMFYVTHKLMENFELNWTYKHTKIIMYMMPEE